MKDFNVEFDNWTKITIAKTEKIIAEAAGILFERIIKDTPVDTGYLRGNWQTSIGSPITDQIDRLDPGASIAAHEARTVAANFKNGQPLYMANNADYAGIIEYGSWSQQAPYGMMRVNILGFQSILDEVSRRNK